MKRKIAVLVLTLHLSVFGADATTPREPTRNFQDFVDESTVYLREQLAKAQADFKLGSYERYDYDQVKSTLTWSSGGVPKVVAKIQFVGSTSFTSKTWLWSWANPSILEPVKVEIRKVKQFGEKMKFTKLIEAKWAAEEVDGWEMTAIAAKVLQAKGAYRSPDERGFAFLIFTDIQWAK